MSGEIDSIASRFDSVWLRSYARAKLNSDPVYEAVWKLVEGTNHPLLDVGCGIGLLPMFLRARGYRAVLTGLDTDTKKINVAQAVAAGDSSSTTFEVRDARQGFGGFSGSVALLDILHYLPSEDQRNLLKRCVRAVPTGGMVIIRDCPRDGSWRYRATYLEEWFATTIGWLRVPMLNFPTRDDIAQVFESAGFSGHIAPLWGNTPFNNHLFVFQRP